MTDIEKKALALLNEVRDERGFRLNVEMQREDMAQEALCRAIEQHEAFRQVVNCEMLEYRKWCKSVGLQFPLLLERFIISKPDPLVEALAEAGYGSSEEAVYDLRAAIEKRGGKIVWGEG